MSPEAEKEVLAYLRDLKKANDGVTLAAVYRAVRSLSDGLLELGREIQKIDAKARRRADRHHERIWALEHPEEAGSMRPPMPSLSADDSGSIDVSILGSSAKFSGRGPVRVAVTLLLVAALLAGGVVLHMAFATPRGATPQQQVTGAKP